jgi:cytosine/adenosine deaminase-related metal-dependent hydrolase
MGTDGLNQSMVEEFRLATLRQRARGVDLKSAVRLAFWNGFRGNAELATAHFGPPLGCIRPGARADLVVLDYVPATPLDGANFADHLFSSPSMGRVHSVVVNGRVLYQNGEFTQLDEARLRARAREISNELWEPN